MWWGDRLWRAWASDGDARDVGRETDVLRLFGLAEREFGAIGGLVNNAAVTGGFARVERVAAEAMERVVVVNVAGLMLCSREAVRRMSVRLGGTGGAIVNISSLVMRTGGAGEWVHYAASKAQWTVSRLAWRVKWRRKEFA